MSGKILLIETENSRLSDVAEALRAAYYDVEDAILADTTDRLCNQADIDLILIGVAASDCAGMALCSRLKADADTALIPVVILVDDWASGGAAGFAAGAEDVLVRGAPQGALLARVRSLIRMKHVYDELYLRERTAEDLGVCAEAIPARGRVLIAAPDPTLAGLWASALGEHAVSVADSVGDLVDRGGPLPPDAIVLHEDFAGGTGMGAIVEIRSRVHSRHTPILFVPRRARLVQPTLALDLGANDYILPPVRPDELCQRVSGLVRRNKIADRLRRSLRAELKSALTDSLTGLHNRRYALAHLARVLDRADRDGTPVALLMLDIDRFKEVNDRFGHQMGDAVLREASERIRNAVRSVDLVARVGGEEFLVVMPGASAADAARVADRIRRDVRGAARVLPLDAGRDITLSAGIAVATGEAHVTSQDLIDRADRALYVSKDAGRDRVSVHRAA